MITIRQVTRYVVEGEEFDSVRKAKDHVDDLVNRLITPTLIAKGVSPYDTVKITEAILDNRHRLAELLAVELDIDPDDE